VIIGHDGQPRCAWAGAGVLLHDGFVAERIARELETHAVTHISLVPADRKSVV